MKENAVIETMFDAYLDEPRAAKGEKPLEDALHVVSADLDKQIEAGKVDHETVALYEYAARKAGYYEGWKAGFNAALTARA